MSQSPDINLTHKAWASHLRTLVGGSVSVHAYYDDERKTKINIFRSTNTEGSLVATVGLMDLNQSRNTAVQVFTEILVDRKGQDNEACNLASTIAFYMMKNGWKVAPGAIFESLLPLYLPDTKLPHVLFLPPFQWDTMSKVTLGEKVIHPLCAIPISKAEANLVSAHGASALEHLWESTGVDVLDWGRASAA